MNSQVLIDLLPCPFCGGDSNARPESQHLPGCYFDVLAKLKAAKGADLSLAPEVLKAWNRRATPAPIPDAAEGVEVVGTRYSCVTESGRKVRLLRLSKQKREGWKSEELMTVAQHQRIVSALRDGGGVERWIACSERMPEPQVDVWVRGLRRGCMVCHGVAGLFGDPAKWMSQETQELTKFEVTHWQPLPAAPLSKLETTTSQPGVGE